MRGVGHAGRQDEPAASSLRFRQCDGSASAGSEYPGTCNGSQCRHTDEKAWDC